MADNLSELDIGNQRCAISYEKDANSYRNRLMVMGLVPNTEFKVVPRALLGDSMESTVQGYSLSF